MKHDDSDLIQQTLDGDEQSFATLVKKYQKQIHALAWQKIGDFHIAQEITQDAFLTAFQKLSTLTNPNRFAGWLYVITNRKCISWHRQKKQQPQSLEETDQLELEEMYYSEYMTQQRQEAANQKQRAIVQKLLSTLQESERTVVNMYYIAEMTCEDIGKFLGVSPNTVRSRLHRARIKMKKDEAMIKENLSSFQLPSQLTETIMEKISQLNPVSPSGSKPLVPLAVSAASAILVLFLLGIGVQNQAQYQQPYSLDTASEATVEIVDTQIEFVTPTTPNVVNKVGSSIKINNNGVGQNPNTALNSAQVDNGMSDKIGKWSETNGPVGGEVVNLFTSFDGDVFAGTKSGIYKLTDDKAAWTLINSRDIFSHREQMSGMRSGPMIERDGILYLATDREILTSTDRGITWDTLSDHPGGGLIDLVMVDHTFYLCLNDEYFLSGDNGVYRSDDNGVSWVQLTPFDERHPDIQPRAIAVFDNTVFVGTNKGLYRLNGATWEQIFLDKIGEKSTYLPVISIEVSDNVLYVARSYDICNSFRQSSGKLIKSTPPTESNDTWSVVRDISSEVYEVPWSLRREIDRARASTDLSWALFQSNDLGNTWQNITPRKNNTDKEELSLTNLFNVNSQDKKDKKTKDNTSSHISGGFSPLKIAVTNNNVMLIDEKKHYHSSNSGETWKTVDTVPLGNASAIVMVNDNTFYRSGNYGINRTTDGGKSWHQINMGLVNTDVWQLIAVNGTLYANSIDGFVYSIDDGQSWIPVNGDTGYITRIMESNGDIYVRDDKTGVPRFYRLSTKDHRLVEMSEMPILDKIDPWKENHYLRRPSGDMGRYVSHGDGSFSESQLGGFAIVNGIFYTEYCYQLYRWKPDTSEWFNTGLLDKGTSEDRSYCYANNIFIDAIGFRFAVSGNTVYVGKKEGQLMQSLDEGMTWTDVTGNLQFHIDNYRAITIADNFVYVATDRGVVMSNNGVDWHTLTNTDGRPLIITMFAVDGTTVYGESKQRIYKVNNDMLLWEKVTPKIEYTVTCIDVDENTLYVGTSNKGVLRYRLDN